MLKIEILRTLDHQELLNYVVASLVSVIMPAIVIASIPEISVSKYHKSLGGITVVLGAIIRPVARGGSGGSIEPPF